MYDTLCLTDEIDYHKTTLKAVITVLPTIEKSLAEQTVFDIDGYNINMFSMNDYDFEPMIKIPFTGNTKLYYELHYLFRTFNIEFMWMKTTHKCAFMKLHLINRFPLVKYE